MEIKEYVNKWMSTDLIYWKDFNGETNNLKFVNEEDRKFITNEGYFFGKCIGTIEEYLIFYTGRFTLRILPELVRNIYPMPKFEWGDKVQEVERPEIKGEIINLVWHLKNQEYKYFIKVNGKPKSRRYSPNELVLQDTELNF